MSGAAAAGQVADMSDYAHDWALVDVETSGLRPHQHRVLSVAVITLGPGCEPQQEFSTLLNPGGDTGPDHIHGLTPERLRGAPTFGQVAGRIGAMLQDRVLVAHNAQFDYDFLAHEFARAGLWLPVTRRLCTIALNRRVGPSTHDLKLRTLAAHYGVGQQRAHDALDDTRVLAGILRGTLSAAAPLGIPLPFVACPPRQNPRFAPKPPKAPCAFRNPGPLPPGGPLEQGMKIAISGETATSRAELTGKAVAAGLNIMSSVSRHTSALVTNSTGSGSAKVRRASAEGIPVIDEHAFLRLLKDVRPGTPHTLRVAPQAGPDAASQIRQPTAPLPGPRQPESRAARRPLAQRRILVLAGSHADGAAARARAVELGASAAVNLSAGVTDVLVLPGGERDRRMKRIAALGLPVHTSEWLADPGTATARSGGTDTEPASRPGPEVLPRGGVVDLPQPSGTSRWAVTTSWSQRADCEVDVVAFALDEEDQVSCDEDFVFYGAPESPDGAVRLSTDGPSEQSITVDLSLLTPATRKVVVAAAIDEGRTFGQLGAVEITAVPGGSSAALAQATLDAATTERTLLLAEVYRRGPAWRFRAVGQGYDHDLASLARSYGVDITS